MRIVRCSFALLVFSLCLAATSLAASLPADPDAWCGTGDVSLEVSAALHRDNQARLQRDRAAGKALQGAGEAFKVGDVAVLVDDGSIVVQPNHLDLDDLGVQYVPQKKGGLVASPSGDPVSEERGARIDDLGDDDSRLIAFPKGFKFRFYNKVYTKMFVHSDGNLTFGVADAASTERSLDRLLAGPPRIAPLFSDLDPAAATGEAGVYVLTSKTKVVITWLDVPLFGQANNRSTFQVVLYPAGRITFAFAGLDGQEAVVGVSPGGSSDVQLVDYSAGLPSGIVKVAIAERFAAQLSFDHLAIAKLFFREFADDYDHLVAFLDFSQILGGNAFAFEMTIRNEILGMGEEVFDGTALVGSRGRLRSFVQMGSLSRYPDDPAAVFLGTNSTLALLGHETGHRWLAQPDIIDENGNPSDVLRGRQRAHWSFCFNSLASHVEGVEWRDNGGGSFSAVGASQRFSLLDRYLMGLIPADDVTDSFYIDPCGDREQAPTTGIVIFGRPVPVAIDQIIAAEGPRVPAANKAPHSFNMAFVIVGAAGQIPSEGSIAKVDRFRAAYEPYFQSTTDGTGSISTVLKVKPRR